MRPAAFPSYLCCRHIRRLHIFCLAYQSTRSLRRRGAGRGKEGKVKHEVVVEEETKQSYRRMKKWRRGGGQEEALPDPCSNSQGGATEDPDSSTPARKQRMREQIRIEVRSGRQRSCFLSALPLRQAEVSHAAKEVSLPPSSSHPQPLPGMGR